MADASNLQTSFLGGEWSPYAQGRAEAKDYRAALNICLNAYPIECGSWARRPGTRFAATTRLGQKAWLLPFAFAQNAPYIIEFTNQFIRLFNGPTLVSTDDPHVVTSISTGTPAVVTVQDTYNWNNGDTVQFIFADGQSYPGGATIMNRQFVIVALNSKTFSISDPITGNPIDGSTISIPGSVAQVVRVQELASPYSTPQLPTINRIQAEGTVVTLAPSVTPWSLTQTTKPTAAAFARFAYAPTVFTDGPYMDPVTTGTITPSGTSGAITLGSAPSGTFVSTDVGRMVRLLSEPLAFNPATGYTTGQSVKYNDLYYTALVNSTGKAPDQYPLDWAPTTSTTVAVWSWGTITGVNSDTNVNFTVKGVPLLYTTAVSIWRLGLYSATTGYPTCGVYHEGRLWLAGAQGNRFDASNSNASFDFHPTEGDGTVTDANAISYVFNAEDVNEIFWMLPDNNGIVCGTQGGEWMIAASQLSDPLTPTSIQAHRRSKYKSANAQAVHAGMSLLFVQAQARKVMEYVADVFSGKFLGRNLNEMTRHLTSSGIAQIVYQQEMNPVMWVRNNDGSLAGSTYKRESSFTNEPPTINGWHHHVLGSGRMSESLAVGPSVDGTLETLAMVTNDPLTNIRHVEFLTNMFDENQTLNSAWFLDDAVTPTAAVENSAGTTVTFYGMAYLVGKTVSVWAGGLDLGDYVVQANGSVVVPVNTTGNTTFPGLNLFTDAYLTALQNSGETFSGFAVFLNRSVTVKYPTQTGITVQEQFPDPSISHNPGVWLDGYADQETLQVGLGNTSTDGFTICDRFTGVEKRHQQANGIILNGVTVCGPVLGAGPWKNQFIYYSINGANNTTIVKLNTRDFSLAGSFGISGSGFNNDNAHIANMGSACIVTAAGVDFLLSCSFAGPNRTLTVINTDSMTWAGHTFTSTDTDYFQCCAGEELHNGPFSYSAAYSISRSDTVVGLYRTIFTNDPVGYYNAPGTTGVAGTALNGAITTTRVGGVAIAAIDGTWSKITSCAGLAFDRTDGNVLIAVFTTDSVTNPYYLLKLNSATGAIIWKTAIPNATFQLSNTEMQQSTIKHGTFSFLMGSSSHYINTINTSTGAITQTSVTGVGGSGGVSNDIDGSLLFDGSFLPGGDVTGIGGTVGYTSKVGLLQGFPQFPGQVTDTQSGAIPVVIGFTYNSDGQVLRGIAPDATGARNGPAVGKTRRVHRGALYCANTQGLLVGTTFDKLHPAVLSTTGGTPLAVNVMFTGVHSMTVEDNNSYNGMLAWRINRPYPATVGAAENFLQTQDR